MIVCELTASWRHFFSECFEFGSERKQVFLSCWLWVVGCRNAVLGFSGAATFVGSKGFPSLVSYARLYCTGERLLPASSVIQSISLKIIMLCKTVRSVILLFSGFFLTNATFAGVRLAQQPSLSPDGKTLLFVRGGDIWQVPTRGGQATRLTSDSAKESQPIYSPRGKRIAFVSNRTGSDQVYVMPATGGKPKQLTFHSEGYSLQDWYPDGNSLLVLASRDHHWKSSSRFFRISSKKRSPEKLLFNGYGAEGKISPDGKKLLFVREGERWWRKGYVGARSAQIWTFGLQSGKFSKVVDTAAGDRSPIWNKDSESFFFCSSHGARNGARNLWKCEVETGKTSQVTDFNDDLVATPTISADGNSIVFSKLFDLYRWEPNGSGDVAKINIQIKASEERPDTFRRILTSASDAAFSDDGLEIAFISGGDLWVMETELKEPVRITKTAEFETDPVFIEKGNAILFVGWKGGQPDIWKVERKDPSVYWWQSEEFKLTQITDDAEKESDLQLSPNKQDLVFAHGRGDLRVLDLEKGKSETLVDSFSTPAFDVSPDGKWIVYARTDDNFNSDIWIAPIDGESEAINISRHPDDEYGPKWSPDGSKIAFYGRRSDDEIDIYYVYLTREENDVDSRDRRLKKTLEALKKSRGKSTSSTKPEESGKKASESSAKDEKQDSKSVEKKEPKADETKNAKADEENDAKTDGKKKAESAEDKKPDLPEVKIDFELIHRRLERLSNANSSERVLGWSPDGSKLIFTGKVKNESGTWYVSFPDELTPKKITSSSGSIKGWLKSPDRMLWLANGVPAAQPISGSGKSYSFSAYQEISRAERFRAGFDAAWMVMRDAWYDKNYGNHDWDVIREKYGDAAFRARDMSEFGRVVTLMLGELNGSHLGFYPSADLGTRSSSSGQWTERTAHLGVRFDEKYKGPGLKVKDVIDGGPASDTGSLLLVDEIILAIDGTNVKSGMDLTKVLNGRSSRDIELTVKSAGKKISERNVLIRPTSYSRIRSLLYDKWQDDNREMVAQEDKKIGYLHIEGMNWSSFLEFERELFDVGYGKDGLIIDVRDNGGGSTTDHLLTALTQPEHAITVPRGGGPGYPQSRRVYATWSKPIVVLCNQNSYSNAEIFSHAIKNLGRGRLVGVPTAGGVISTGSASVMDVGRIRVPFRGWYVKSTGEDMELNGAIPNFVVWPKPAEIPNGKDRQLMKAVSVLQEDIAAWKKQEQPKLIKATER